MTRALAFALLLIGAAGLITIAILERPPAPELPDRMIVEVASFDDLPGWGERGRGYFHAIEGLCAETSAQHQTLVSYTDIEDGALWNESFGGAAATYGDGVFWFSACFQAFVDLSVTAAMIDSAGAEVPAGPRERRSQHLIERLFTPLRIRNNSETTGMFTGYYEPELQGSRTQTEEFSTPLLTRPDDLVIVQLGEFPGDHDGRIAGRVVDGNLKPFESRTEIEEGALTNAEPLAWVRPVDAFFLQIQGSGRVVFEDGSVLRAGYDGVNGHPYTAIGRTLIQRGALTLENVSMQSIRDWLEANPDDAVEVMRSNASYVFFREIEVEDASLGPIGAAGVPLTPGYSLAVDPRYHAYGAPVYISTVLPDGTPFQRLMVAQDTGGAIRGPIRGDIFFGYGDDAGAVAGGMRAQGEMWVLVPNTVAERLLAEQATQESE